MNTPFLPRKRRLGELLIEAGMVDELQLRVALSEQKKWGGKLGRTLVELGFVDEQSIVLALSTQLGLPPVDLDTVRLPKDVGSFLRLDIVERYGVFPMRMDAEHKILQIASSDPTNVEALQEITFQTGMKLKLSVATASSIDRAIRRYYYGESTTSTPTTTPSALGIDGEPNFDFGLDDDTVGGFLAGGTAAPIPPEVAQKLDELGQRMGVLEKMMTTQVRAMRALLEMLVEKSGFSREEFIERVRGNKKPPA